MLRLPPPRKLPKPPLQQPPLPPRRLPKPPLVVRPLLCRQSPLNHKVRCFYSFTARLWI
jgi:hypothetical protein